MSFPLRVFVFLALATAPARAGELVVLESRNATILAGAHDEAASVNIGTDGFVQLLLADGAVVRVDGPLENTALGEAARATLERQSADLRSWLRLSPASAAEEASDNVPMVTRGLELDVQPEPAPSADRSPDTVPMVTRGLAIGE